MDKAAKIVGAGDEIGFAVDFDQHADLAAGVDVSVNQAFGGDAARLLGRGREAALAQDFDGFLFVTG